MKSVHRYAVLVVAALAAPLLATSPAHAAPAPAATGVAEKVCADSPGRFTCLSERMPTSQSLNTSARSLSAAVSTFTGYTPADLRAAYNIPTSSTHATVAVVDAYGDSSVESDLALYRSHFGLPACTRANGCLRVVNQYGNTSPLPANDTDWMGETSLDVDMVSAVCPSCSILLVQANNSDTDGKPNLEDAVNTAAQLGAKYISMSWGGPEWSQQPQADSYTLNHPGVVMVASAGDNGHGASWPAANPNVVAVGGTALNRTTANSRRFTEQVWGSSTTPTVGTGAGCSVYEPRPAWQAIAPITSVCSRRAMNDVSIVADPKTGVQVVQGGKLWIYGGTSAGSPMIAAMYALAGAPGSQPASSVPYGHRSSFTDVTSGQDGCRGASYAALCTGQTGWDGPTGVGTPWGVSGFSPLPKSTMTLRSPGSISTYAGSAATVHVTGTSSARVVANYRVSGLPSGVSATATSAAYGTAGTAYTFTLSGMPRTAHTYPLSISLTDTTGGSASTSFSWTVKPHRIYTSTTPHVSGTARVGHTLSAYYGSFRRDSTRGTVIRPTVHYQWYRDGRAVRGATHSTLKPSTYYRHHRLSVRITATATYYNAYGYTTRTVSIS